MFISRELLHLLAITRYSREWCVGWVITLGVCALYFFIRLSVVPEIWRKQVASFSLEEGIGTRLATLLIQLRHVLDPRLPILSDAVPIVGIGPNAIGGAGVLFFLIAGAVRWRRGEASWFCAFFLIALLPSLNLVMLPRFTSPHYGYLLSFVFGMAVVLVLKRALMKESTSKFWICGLIGTWAMVAAASTFLGGSRFEDDFTLFGPSVKRDARHLEGHLYLGYSARQGNDLEKAAKHYTASLKFRADTLAWWDWELSLISLAEIRVQQGRFDEASRLLERLRNSGSNQHSNLLNYYQDLIDQERPHQEEGHD